MLRRADVGVPTRAVRGRRGSRIGTGGIGPLLPWLLLASIASPGIRAQDADCERMLAEDDVSLDTAVAAGCELTAQQIALALGWLGRRWTLGTLAQHWCSVAGDDDRGSVSQTNVQYFVYRKLGRQWSLGAAPNVTLDWLGDDAPTVNAPLGIGVNKTVLLGGLPVRFGIELTGYVLRESEIEPERGLRLSMTPVVPSALLPW